MHVTLFNDEAAKGNEVTTEKVARDLESLFSYTHQWALKHMPDRGLTLTFSSMLASGKSPCAGGCSGISRSVGWRAKR